MEEYSATWCGVILKTSLLNPFVLSKGWPLLSRNRDETGTLDEARSTTVQTDGLGCGALRTWKWQSGAALRPG